MGYLLWPGVEVTASIINLSLIKLFNQNKWDLWFVGFLLGKKTILIWWGTQMNWNEKKMGTTELKRCVRVNAQGQGHYGGALDWGVRFRALLTVV